MRVRPTSPVRLPAPLALLAAAAAGCAPAGPAGDLGAPAPGRPPAVERAAGADAPVIVDRPIAFSERRKAATRAYIREHYGIDAPDIEIVPRIVVLHWTAITDLEASFNTFDRELLAGRPDLAGAGDVNVSAHFLVDRDGTIYRLMPETWMARHVIGLNYDAIGIENVGTGTEAGGDLTDAQLDANIRLVRWLAARHPTLEYVIGHHEYRAFEGHPLWRELDAGYRTAKIDPGVDFTDAVRAALRGTGLRGPPE